MIKLGDKVRWKEKNIIGTVVSNNKTAPGIALIKFDKQNEELLRRSGRLLHDGNGLHDFSHGHIKEQNHWYINDDELELVSSVLVYEIY